MRLGERHRHVEVRDAGLEAGIEDRHVEERVDRVQDGVGAASRGSARRPPSSLDASTRVRARSGRRRARPTSAAGSRRVVVGERAVLEERPSLARSARRQSPTPPVPTTRIRTASGFYRTHLSCERATARRYAPRDFRRTEVGRMSVAVTQQKQFIGGEFVDSTSGETMEVLNPATGEVIAEVPQATAEDVERAVDAAKKALGRVAATRRRRTAWSCCSSSPTSSTRTRRSSRGSSRSTSASRGGSPVDEPGVMSDNLRFFARRRPQPRGQGRGRVRRGLHVDDPARAARHRRGDLPRGTTRSSWRCGRSGRRSPPGNVQIIKPAEQTPLTMLRFVELAQESSRRGVLQVVTGDGDPGRRRARAPPRHPARLAHRRHRDREDSSRRTPRTP